MFVDSVYREHFKSGQGFSVTTLKARKVWFTPTLYSLLLHDMDRTPERGELGYLDADPFTDAQDDAQTYAIGEMTHTRDTLLVSVNILFGPTFRKEDQKGLVIVSLLRVDNRWRIADVRLRSGSLVAGLRANPE